METESSDPSVARRAPEESWRQRERPHAGALQEFAQNMSDDIMRSLMGGVEQLKHEGPTQGLTQGPAEGPAQGLAEGPAQGLAEGPAQGLAEGLAALVLDAALRDLCPGEKDPAEALRRFGEQADDGQAAEQSSDAELQSCTRGAAPQPPLPRSGLPAVGSLDYPDAPPTTPLLPELHKSRCSFARKLKGGLAREFLPSPPPSTPKEEDGVEGGGGGGGVELLEHLMRSLSAEDLGGGGGGAQLEAFAEALALDVVDAALRAGSGGRAATDRQLHLLAHRLAHNILASSLQEAAALM